MMATVLRPSNILRVRSALPLLQRHVHISATPSVTSINGIVDLSVQTQAIPKLSGSGPFPAETSFEVLGAPYSLLSIALPASSNLYTRRGTLLGLNGRPSDATSTLSVLSPLTRAARGIPFLYQKVTSTTPLTCIISTNTPNTTFCVLALDGTADWNITQPDALLAWSGHSITVKPQGVTGRGLVALVGRGQVYQVALKKDEEFIVHHHSLLAYSAVGQKPSKVRLAATSLRFQVPRLRLGLGISQRLKEVEWINAVWASKVWEVLAKAVWAVKTAMRADREFLKFVGPATVLLQSRTGGRIRDLISRQEMGEYAAVQSMVSVPRQRVETVKVIKSGLETAKQASAEKETTDMVPTVSQTQTHAGSLKRAVVTRVGHVEFEDSNFKEFKR